MTDTDPLADLIDAETDPSELRESAAIYPLVADSGNRAVLEDWIDGHDSHRLADTDEPVTVADFDLCIVDEGGLREHRDELERAKSEASSTLLPVLLLLPEARAEVIDVDDGAIAENVFETTVDEIVSLPIRQVELEWRIKALLRLRRQSLSLQTRANKLELFRQAVEHSGHAVYITDPDGHIKYVNPAFEEITGYSQSEVVGKTPRVLNSGEMPDEYFDRLWDTLLAGERWSAEIVDRRKSGDLYHAAQTIAPITEDGEVKAFVAVQNDVTERKEREQTLERRTQAIEEAPVGVAITDPDQPDNPLIYVNEAFEEMTGYSREEATGRNCRFLQGENTDAERVARIREAVDDEEPISLDIRNYRKTGTEFWNHLELAPVRDDDGAVVNYVGFQQDVTERRQRSQQLQILGRILRHNIRNEMSVVQGWAERIRSGSSADAGDEAERIIRKSEELTDLAEKERAITDLLTRPPQQVPVDLDELTGYVERTVRREFPDAAIRVECPPEITVSATAQLEQAVEELARNAVEHNDAGRASVDLSVTETEQDVRIVVSDDAPAIPEMERSVLFGNFDQTSMYHGSGLGLWLVNLIVTRSGGSVTHETDGSRGNVVEIVLPAWD